MQVGHQLSELNMTADELDKLTDAFKDETFRGMLRDYVQEISDPENRERYEAEIKLMEQERGNSIEFIHPTPFRALRTSVNGKQKCFINICGNDKVAKPECKCGVSEDGRRGQCWSLPHSLHPGRQDTDAKGNRMTIYDVVFHPDTLHIASRSKNFMDMVDKTAIQGIQNSFNVTLDENNVRELNAKYKGSPQPCVVRKPIPGHKAKEPWEGHDPLSFPYPDTRRPNTSSQAKPAESTAAKNSSDTNPKSFQIRFQKTNEPTKPSYTVKYRSVIDLQDFRCSRDSARSPRPKEIVVTVDLPLVKSVTDASLEAKERTLLLETKKPAYRLELPLAYPVDEDKGQAKFNKQTGQLTVTLPVLPSDKGFDFATGLDKTASDVQSGNDERQENSRELEEDIWDGKETEGSDVEEGTEKKGGKAGAEGLMQQQTRVETSDDEKAGGRGKGKGQRRVGQETAEGKGHVVGEGETLRRQNKEWQESVEEGRGAETQKRDKIYEGEQEEEEEEKFKKQQDDEEQAGKCELQENKRGERFSKGHLWGDGCDRAAEESQQETATGSIGEEGKVHLDPAAKLTSSDTENTEQVVDSPLKWENDAAFQDHVSGEESQPTAAVSLATPTSSSHIITGSCMFQGSGEFERPHATDGKHTVNTGRSGNRHALFPEDLTMGSGKQEDADEDDLPREQEDRLSAVVLREIDEDGNEKIISDHSTSAGMIFQNTLIYQLD